MNYLIIVLVCSNIVLWVALFKLDEMRVRQLRDNERRLQWLEREMWRVMDKRVTNSQNRSPKN